MPASRKQRPVLQRATCAALIAASFAVGSTEAPAAIASIQRYCQTSWRQAGIPPSEWEDCTQETIAELLARLPHGRVDHALGEGRSPERRELMRSVWCVAQRWRRACRRQSVSLESVADAPVDGIDVGESLARTEQLRASLRRLSDPQRRVLELWSTGHSVAEIAAELRIPAARVSDLKYKGVRALREQLQTEEA